MRGGPEQRSSARRLLDRQVRRHPGRGDTGGDRLGRRPAAAADGSPAPGSSAAGSGDAALKGNTKAICAQAAKTGGDAAKNFAQDLKLLIDAESAQDKAAVAAAKEKTSRDVENYSFALGDMAKLASEPQLKKALGAMSKQVSALKGDVRKLDAEKLNGLQETLSKACGTD